MAGPEFFQTGMGRKFFESTMPDLIRQLDRLNKNIEKVMESKGTDEFETELKALREVMKEFDPNDPQGFLEKLKSLQLK